MYKFICPPLFPRIKIIDPPPVCTSPPPPLNNDWSLSRLSMIVQVSVSSVHIKIMLGHNGRTQFSITVDALPCAEQAYDFLHVYL